MHEITILKMIKITGKEMLRAFANVSIDDITINGVRLMHDPKGDWLALPQTSFVDKSGKKKYTPIIEVSEALKKRIKEAVVKEYNQN